MLVVVVARVVEGRDAKSDRLHEHLHEPARLEIALAMGAQSGGAAARGKAKAARASRARQLASRDGEADQGSPTGTHQSASASHLPST